MLWTNLFTKGREEKLLKESDKAYYACAIRLMPKKRELRHKIKEKEKVEHLLADER